MEEFIFAVSHSFPAVMYNKFHQEQHFQGGLGPYKLVLSFFKSDPSLSNIFNSNVLRHSKPKRFITTVPETVVIICEFKSYNAVMKYKNNTQLAAGIIAPP